MAFDFKGAKSICYGMLHFRLLYKFTSMAGLYLFNISVLKDELEENCLLIDGLKDILMSVVMIYGWQDYLVTVILTEIDRLSWRNAQIVQFMDQVDGI